MLAVSHGFINPDIGVIVIKIDGSHHDWFCACCLLVIDDATGRLMHCGSASQKPDYMLATPASSSMGSRYRCTVTNTQYFASVVRRNAIPPLPSSDVCFLAIELICASSEAKGRVERANQTLQDRLIKSNVWKV